jgi:hypothetical protein
LPVLARFSVYLTVPSFGDVEKILNQKISGKFIFKHIKMQYNFTNAFSSELDFEPRFPFKLKIQVYMPLNKSLSEPSIIDIKVIFFFKLNFNIK